MPIDLDDKATAAEQLQKVLEDNLFLKNLFMKYKGVENPFICGGSKEQGEDGLPEYIMVCPALGADGYAVYKKYKDYDAPSY